MKQASIIGDYSGRSAGDAAALDGFTAGLLPRFPGVRFLVPTTNPCFVRQYGAPRLVPVGIGFRHGSLRLLGVAAWRSLSRSAVVLLTGSLSCDRGFLNPAQPMLSTLAAVVPALRRRRVPLVGLNVGVALGSAAAGAWCANRILRACDTLILRDDASLRSAVKAGVPRERCHPGAEPVLLAPPSSEDRVQMILRETGIKGGARPRIGVGISRFRLRIAACETRIAVRGVSEALVEVFEHLQAQLGVDIWFFATQREDIRFARQMQAALSVSGSVPLFTSDQYSHRDLMGLMGKVEMVVAMDTSTAAMAAAMGRPLISIVTHPAANGFLERIGQERWSIPVAEVSFGNLRRMIERCWEERFFAAADLRRQVERERALARKAVELLRPYLA